MERAQVQNANTSMFVELIMFFGSEITRYLFKIFIQIGGQAIYSTVSISHKWSLVFILNKELKEKLIGKSN